MDVLWLKPRSSQPTVPNHMLSSRLIRTAPHLTFKIFSSHFDVDCKEVPLQLQMELSDFQWSEE